MENRPSQEDIEKFSSQVFKENKETELKPQFGLLSISGGPGSGTSTLVKEAASQYGIPQDRLIKVGDLIRGRVSEKIMGYVQRSEDIDLEFDNLVRAMTLNSTKDDPSISEGQLSGWIVTDELKNSREKGINPQGPIIKVLLWANKETRVKRIQEREGGGLSLREINRLTTNRERGDLEYWKSIYPRMDINPLEKNNKIYDLEIDNTNLNPQETFEYLNNYLTRLGMIKENSD